MVHTPRATWTGVGPAPQKLETFSKPPRQIWDQNAAGPVHVPKPQRLESRKRVLTRRRRLHPLSSPFSLYKTQNESQYFQFDQTHRYLSSPSSSSSSSSFSILAVIGFLPLRKTSLKVRFLSPRFWVLVISCNFLVSNLRFRES